MKKNAFVAMSSALMACGISLVGGPAWAEDGPPIGSVIVGTESVTIVEAGQAFTARVTNQVASKDFCGVPADETVSGNTMAIKLYDASGGEILYTIPDAYGEGSQGILPTFSWTRADNTTVDVSATIPVSAVPGEYKIGFECVGPSAGGYLVNGINPVPLDIVIIAASNEDPVTPPDPTTEDPTLAHTGVDEASNYALAGASALLIAAGAAIRIIRKRASVKN